MTSDYRSPGLKVSIDGRAAYYDTDTVLCMIYILTAMTCVVLDWHDDPARTETLKMHAERARVFLAKHHPGVPE